LYAGIFTVMPYAAPLVAVLCERRAVEPVAPPDAVFFFFTSVPTSGFATRALGAEPGAVEDGAIGAGFLVESFMFYILRPKVEN
jgi:hypothetical protein